MATLNQHPIRLSIIGTPTVGKEVEIRVLIAHPMETGYRLGGDGNERIPKNIIDNIVIKFNQEPIMIAKLGTGIAANPLISVFMEVPVKGGMVSVEWKDDQGAQGRAEKMLVVV
jgi:sulfur-oxidizing protein SoxZ